MSQTPPRARWIVAIPARNEARRLPGALAALDAAAARTGAEVRALVFANGCGDGTAEAARAVPLARVHLTVRVETLPPHLAHAGGARRAAVAAARAAFGAGPQDRLLTTDADCRLAPDALAMADAAFAGGADLVLAKIDCAPDPWSPADPAGVAWGTPGVLWRHKVRALTEALRTGRAPSPLIHDDYGGAGIAVTPRAYDALGGFAPVPSDEDRMLVAGADRMGLMVHRWSGMAVTALTRSVGRASGGMADAIERGARMAAAGRTPMVERSDLTLARLRARPCHAHAFAARVAAWEPAGDAIPALDAAMAEHLSGAMRWAS